MSETKRVGPWVVEDNHTAFALMGSVVLDLRQAQFETRELTLYAHAVMGEVRIVVDAGTTVVVEGTAVMGEYSEQRARRAVRRGEGRSRRAREGLRADGLGARAAQGPARREPAQAPAPLTGAPAGHVGDIWCSSHGAKDFVPRKSSHRRKFG